MAEKVQFGTTVLPETVATIERLAKVEGKSKGELVDIAVAAYDAEPEIVTDAPELPDDASIVLLIPRDKEMLIAAFSNLIISCQKHVHEMDIWKALACARTEFQKGTREYQSAEKMRADRQARLEQAARPLSYTKKGPSLT